MSVSISASGGRVRDPALVYGYRASFHAAVVLTTPGHAWRVLLASPVFSTLDVACYDRGEVALDAEWEAIVGE